MHRRADRYRSIAIVKGYRTVKILWPTDECRKSSRLYKWENRAIFSHFWYPGIIKSSLIVTNNCRTINSRDRAAIGGAKTTVTIPYYGRIVLNYM